MGIEASVKELLLNQIKVISENNPNKDGKPEPLYTSFVRWACENILNIKDDFDVEDAISIGGKSDYGIDFFQHDSVGDEEDQSIIWG
jgi:hypothetical protein